MTTGSLAPPVSTLAGAAQINPVDEAQPVSQQVHPASQTMFENLLANGTETNMPEKNIIEAAQHLGADMTPKTSSEKSGDLTETLGIMKASKEESISVSLFATLASDGRKAIDKLTSQ